MRFRLLLTSSNDVMNSLWHSCLGEERNYPLSLGHNGLKSVSYS